jgi:hypothetical protein
MSGLDCLKETLRQGMAWHGTYGGGDEETKEGRKMEKEFGDLCRQFLPRLSHRK